MDNENSALRASIPSADDTECMVRRVAQALASLDCWSFNRLSTERKLGYFLRARTAIEAMRKPTRAMFIYQGRRTGYEETAMLIWAHMIDGALASGIDREAGLGEKHESPSDAQGDTA